MFAFLQRIGAKDTVLRKTDQEQPEPLGVDYGFGSLFEDLAAELNALETGTDTVSDTGSDTGTDATATPATGIKATKATQPAPPQPEAQAQMPPPPMITDFDPDTDALVIEAEAKDVEALPPDAITVQRHGPDAVVLLDGLPVMQVVDGAERVTPKMVRLIRVEGVFR